MLRIVLTSALAAAASLAAAVANEPPNAAQPYSADTSKAVTWTGEVQYMLTAPYHTKLLRVWVPIPPSDSIQTVNHSGFSVFPVNTEPTVHTEPLYGNRFAYFEFRDPQGGIVIRHELSVTTHQADWNINPAKVSVPDEWPAEFQGYLRSEQQSVVADDRFAELLTEIVPRRTNPISDLEAVLSWTDRNFTYSHDKASLKASSLHGLELRTGHCSDYHGFCAAMGRVMSMPTRVTYGISPLPKASPSHCKLEAFIPPYGWVSFDVSETQKLNARIRGSEDISENEKDRLTAAAGRRLARGFRDNTWILQTRGTDYPLVPPTETGPVPLVRTIWAEADGKPLPDPDPTSTQQTTFAWMSAHRFEASTPAEYPFRSLKMLREYAAGLSGRDAQP